MIKLQTFPCLDAEPWITALENRLEKLGMYKSLGFKNVVYLAEWGDQFTFRYRAYNMVQALYGSEEWKGIYVYKQEIARIRQYLDQIDCLVLVRYHWDLDLNEFMDEVKSRAIPVVYDVDDYIFDIRELKNLLAAQGIDRPTPYELDFWHGFVSRIYQAADMADACLTTNAYLADLLKRVMKRNCLVIENFFNYWQYEASNYYYEQKRNSNHSRDEIVFGYFSGSNTHKNDLQLAMNGMNDIFEIFPNTKLLIVGYMELDEKMQKLRDRGQLELKPIQNYVELQKTIAETDINLIPLADSVFTNSKSELKYFEAAIVGTISCASPTYVYKNCMKDGENGYLCQDGEWFSKTYDLCKNGIPESMAETARNAAVEKYAYFHMTKKIEQTLNQIVKGDDGWQHR